MWYRVRRDKSERRIPLLAFSAVFCTRINRTAARERGETEIKALELAQAATKTLLDKKGQDIVLLDVRGISAVTDYYLIVTGTSTPHLKAMYDEVQHELKQLGVYAYRRSGVPEGGWMALDYVDVIIHVFGEEARRYYAIESLWSEARPVDIQSLPDRPPTGPA